MLISKTSSPWNVDVDAQEGNLSLWCLAWPSLGEAKMLINIDGRREGDCIWGRAVSSSCICVGGIAMYLRRVVPLYVLLRT